MGDTPVFSTADTRVMNKQSTHSTVSRELARLDRKERLISRRRRDLHDEIDQLYLGAPLDKTQMAKLDELESLEQAVSRERRKLHERIDQLRAQIGLPRWREQHHEGGDSAESHPGSSKSGAPRGTGLRRCVAGVEAGTDVFLVACEAGTNISGRGRVAGNTAAVDKDGRGRP